MNIGAAPPYAPFDASDWADEFGGFGGLVIGTMTLAQSWPLGHAAAMQVFDKRTVLPVLLVLLAQIGLYVWMAPRGFEFTDEAFYLLNFLHWRELTATVSFFGAYFDLPFRMLGQSVPAIRIFSLVLLLASSAFLTRETLRYFDRNNGDASGASISSYEFVAAGMAGSLIYFGYLSTLRAPSYNLIAVCSMTVATGLLLRLLDMSATLTKQRVAMFCYGLVVGACGLGKPTSGVLLVLLHTVFFVLANRDWRPRRLLEVTALSFLGVALNFGLLLWVHPGFVSALREGVTMVNITDGRSMLSLANWLRTDTQALAEKYLLWVAATWVVFGLLVRWIGPKRHAAIAIIVIAVVGGCAAGLIWGQTRLWLPTLAVGVSLLWGVEAFGRRPFRLTRIDLADFGLVALLFLLPLAFSFGTNMDVLAHSQKAAVFVIVALCLQLHRLAHRGLLVKPALVVCLMALGVPSFVIQLRALQDVNYTYRQLSALGNQTTAVQVGAARRTILVDTTTRQTLESVITAAREAGFAPGQLVLDFTGDGPGLVYALGARPLGTAWLVGGYRGSQATAARLVSLLPADALRDAWLLTSDKNHRAIRNWQSLLDARLGVGAHERVANVIIQAPYRSGSPPPKYIDVQLWKPRVASAPSTTQ